MNRSRYHRTQTLFGLGVFLSIFFLYPILWGKEDPLYGFNVNGIVQIQDLAKGVFIVADPRIVDPNFNQTVVLMLEHGTEGSTGLIINRPTETPLSTLLPEVESKQAFTDLLYTGGPVLKGTLTVLFRSKSPQDRLGPIFGNVYASQEARVLADRLKASGSNNDFRLYSGYAGWSPGQLRSEMARGDWRVAEADAEIIFEKPSDLIWSEMFNRSQELMVNKTLPLLIHKKENLILLTGF